MTCDIPGMLAGCVERHASDLHLAAGMVPMMRVDGELVRLERPALGHEELRIALGALMNERQRKEYGENLETDFSVDMPGFARFRVNVFTQRNGAAAVFRTIPGGVVTLEHIGAPAVLREVALRPQGLVLVTGPSGSGKSTTLAALVNLVNETRAGHLITIEDPIEFVHESRKCLISQREVHRDTVSFAAALRSALREDPDGILIGEMRDLETIRLALTAAETGHIVFATLHTSSAARTVDRVVDVFPAGERALVRSMLAESLSAVIAQTLLRKTRGGRIAAWEIMLGTPAVRNLIREGKVAQLYSTIQTGQALGMRTLEQSLQELSRRGLVAPATAGVAARTAECFP